YACSPWLLSRQQFMGPHKMETIVRRGAEQRAHPDRRKLLHAYRLSLFRRRRFEARTSSALDLDVNIENQASIEATRETAVLWPTTVPNERLRQTNPSAWNFTSVGTSMSNEKNQRIAQQLTHATRDAVDQITTLVDFMTYDVVVHVAERLARRWIFRFRRAAARSRFCVPLSFLCRCVAFGRCAAPELVAVVAEENSRKLVPAPFSRAPVVAMVAIARRGGVVFMVEKALRGENARPVRGFRKFGRAPAGGWNRFNW